MTPVEAVGLPARIALLNGAPGAGARELAEHLQARWRVGVVPVDDLELGLEVGRPPTPAAVLPQDDLVLWQAVAQVGATMAHAYRPLVVAPATVRSRYTLDWLRRQWQGRGVEVAHVVLAASEGQIRSRAQAQRSHPDARRWAIERARGALRDITDLPADVELDAGPGPDRLASELVRGLTRLGWLDDEARWAPAPRRHAGSAESGAAGALEP